MKKFFRKKPELIEIGNIKIKKSKLRYLYKYLIALFPEFKIESFKETKESLILFIENVLKTHEREVLWTYEGKYFYNRALGVISIRPHSTKEIREFLSNKVDNLKTIDIVIDKLETFLDDKEFAEYYIQKERGRNPKSDNVIRFGLKAKGVDEQIINEVMNENEGDEYELVKKQYLKKCESIRNRTERAFIRGKVKNKKSEFNNKMMIYLMSKGFNSNLIKEVIQSHEMDSKE